MKREPELRFPEFSGEWVEWKLGDMVEFKRDKIPTKDLTLDNYISTENILPDFRGIKRANTLPDIKNVNSFKKGDILISNIRPYLKKIWLAPIDGGASSDIIIIRPNSDISYNFLSIRLKSDSFIKYIMSGARGTKMPRGDINQIKEYSFHLPPTLSEQQKIASFLSSIDKKIDLTSKKLEKLKEYKRGLLQKLFPRDKEKEPTLRFSEFSREWVKKRLGEIGKIYQPKTISEKEFIKDGYCVYGANGKIGYYKEYNHKESQVVIACRGSTCGTINKTEEKSWITGNAMVINVDDNKEINKSFLFQILQIQNFNKIIEGSGQPQITQKSLSAFKIPLPPTLTEQQKIASFLSSIDKKIDLTSKKLEKLKEYKRGLLQKMFI